MGKRESILEASISSLVKEMKLISRRDNVADNSLNAENNISELSVFRIFSQSLNSPERSVSFILKLSDVINRRSPEFIRDKSVL